MPAVIGGLFASRLQRDELVAKIDEGHHLVLAAQLKVEDAAIKCQRFLDIADFQRYMVEADSARLCGANHSTLLL
jgi:tryptophan synthase beta subunit